MPKGRRERWRLIGSVAIGAAAAIAAVAKASQGDWAFVALAMVLALVTELTVIELFE